MFKCLNVKMSGRGFTFLEVIFAVFVVTIGVLAAYIVIQQVISYTHLSASRLTAAYLAQEGIEIVRNIKDTNCLQYKKGEEFYYGLVETGYGYGWEADYTTTTFIATPKDSCDCGDPDPYNCHYSESADPEKGCSPSNPLKISQGLYSYNIGSDTKFTREITVTYDETKEALTVSVSVTWKEKGETYGPVTAQEILYDWCPLD